MESDNKVTKIVWLVLAHLAALIAAPLWVVICVFSFLLFANNPDPYIGTYILFGFYWLGPIATVVLLISLWIAMAQSKSQLTIKLSISVFTLQFLAGLLLLTG